MTGSRWSPPRDFLAIDPRPASWTAALSQTERILERILIFNALSVGLNRLLESISFRLLDFCRQKMTWRSALNIARTQADRKDCENVHPGA